MQLLSVNAAQPKTIQFNGEEISTGIYKEPLQGEVKVTALGLEGDTIVDTKVHGGLDQAVYLYLKEDYDWWAEQLDRALPPGTFGENLTVSGLGDHSFVIGDRLLINDIELEITAPRTPCYKLASKMGNSGFVKAFAKAQRPGAYARVIQEGTLKAGDAITLQPTTGNYVSIKEIFVMWHEKNRSLATMEKALASPIASVHKQQIQQWYNTLTSK